MENISLHLKHQRKDTVNQPDTEVCQVGTVVRSYNILSDELGESARQIQRYIRLTLLIPELLEMVDNSEIKNKEIPVIALTPAVELSYLKKEEQKILAKKVNMILMIILHCITKWLIYDQK